MIKIITYLYLIIFLHFTHSNKHAWMIRMFQWHKLNSFFYPTCNTQPIAFWFKIMEWPEMFFHSLNILVSYLHHHEEYSDCSFWSQSWSGVQRNTTVGIGVCSCERNTHEEQFKLNVSHNSVPWFSLECPSQPFALLLAGFGGAPQPHRHQVTVLHQTVVGLLTDQRCCKGTGQSRCWPAETEQGAKNPPWLLEILQSQQTGLLPNQPLVPECISMVNPVTGSAVVP